MRRTNEIERPCFGIACPQRGSCHRYHAVDAAAGDVTMQGTCLRGGEYRDYLPLFGHGCISMPLRPSTKLIEQCIAWANRDQRRSTGTAQHGRA